MSNKNNRERKKKRKKGEKIEKKFKDLIQQNKDYRVHLTQISINKSIKIGGYIAGDAHIYYYPMPRFIAHCEIKTKNRDSTFKYYGLELYRLHDYLKVEEFFKLYNCQVPVFYIIYDWELKIWLYAKFKELWDTLKNGFELFFSYQKRESLGFYSTMDYLLEMISSAKNQERRVFLKLLELKKGTKEIVEPKTIYGKIRLYDKSYYNTNKPDTTATVLYFDPRLFKSIKDFLQELNY